METFREQLRKKVVDMKTDGAGFYTETYNIVTVLLRLNTDADFPEEVFERMALLYNKPSKAYGLSLAQLEDLYFKYKGDFSLKIKTTPRIGLHEVKSILDRARRDLLFYLALLEAPKSNYGILLKEVKKNADR